MNIGRVLITGGTRGIGRAVATELTRAGARVCVTHRWGSVSSEELEAEFAAQGLAAPRVEECDASDREQTAALFERLYAEWGGLDAVVSGVAFASPVAELEKLSRASMEIALGYSTWPLLDLVQLGLARENPPRRFLALSSSGVDRVQPGYDMVAVCKGALETLVRYLAVRCKPRGVVVNALRLGYIDTESLRAVLPGVVDETASRHLFMDAAAGGRAAVAILSGLLDGMTGQVMVVDEGVSLLPPA